MKAGLKTFPLAVDNSDALKLIEAEYGIKGFAVIIKLLQCIFSKGYYTAWGQDERLLFIDDYRLSSVGCAGVTEIAECALRRGVFDSRAYEKYGILTNRAIQETFLKANERTTIVKLCKNYVLPEVYTFIETASKKGKFANIIWKNVDILPTKEKKRKEKIERDNAHAHEAYSIEDILTVCKEECPIIFNRHNKNGLADYKLGQILEELQETMTLDEIRNLLKQAAKKYPSQPNYKSCDLVWVLNNREKVKAAQELGACSVKQQEPPCKAAGNNYGIKSV